MAEATQTETPQVEAPAAPEPKTPGASYYDYCHVGPGAEECDDRFDGTCGDPLHFHAFCRLPNAIQQQDIRDRSLAAKARRIRMLRDSDSDVHEILEGDLYEMERADDRDTLIDEVVAKNFFRDHAEAMREVMERDEFEHIERDQERFREMDAQDPEKRDQEEWDHLVKHITAFGEAVEQERRKREEPQRTALAEKPMGELLTIIREDRIDAEAQAIFMQVYSKWQWFFGTLRPVKDGWPKVRMFGSIDELDDADPKVIEGIDATFRTLEHESAPGNS